MTWARPSALTATSLDLRLLDMVPYRFPYISVAARTSFVVSDDAVDHGLGP